MGITEYFRENPPGERDLNIHDISIEKDEKKEELPFDPEKDITEEDWERMYRELIKHRGESGEDFDGLFPSMAMRMKIIFPKRVNEFGLNDAIWQKMRGYLEHFRQDFFENPIYDEYGAKRLYFIEDAIEMKILFPERVNEINLDDRVWQRMKEILETYRSHNDWGNFCLLAVQIKILYPNKIDQLGLDDDWYNIKKFLDKMKLEIDDPEENYGPCPWGSFAVIASNAKILFPHKFKEFKFDEMIWDNIKSGGLEVYRRNNIEQYQFVYFVMASKILAAHEVTITDEGIECVMRKPQTDFCEKKTPRPERRQF